MVGAYVQLKEETVVFAPKSLQYECKKKKVMVRKCKKELDCIDWCAWQ